MNNEEFNRILADRIIRIEDILGSKAKEYSSKEDRLHNFKAAAMINDTTPPKALWGMAAKHLVSIQDMVFHEEVWPEGQNNPPEDLVNEKIGDMINYLILLEALFKEG